MEALEEEGEDNIKKIEDEVDDDEEETEEDDVQEEESSQEESETIPRKIAAIESHKRSRTTFFICIMGIAGTVLTAIFMSMNSWAGAAAACIFSGTFGMLGVKAIKDFKYLEAAYGLGKKK